MKPVQSPVVTILWTPTLNVEEATDPDKRAMNVLRSIPLAHLRPLTLYGRIKLSPEPFIHSEALESAVKSEMNYLMRELGAELLKEKFLETYVKAVKGVALASRDEHLWPLMAGLDQ